MMISPPSMHEAMEPNDQLFLGYLTCRKAGNCRYRQLSVDIGEEKADFPMIIVTYSRLYLVFKEEKTAEAEI
jgi:hypothetical protein